VGLTADLGKDLCHVPEPDVAVIDAQEGEAKLHGRELVCDR